MAKSSRMIPEDDEEAILTEEVEALVNSAVLAMHTGLCQQRCGFFFVSDQNREYAWVLKHEVHNALRELTSVLTVRIF